MCKAWVLALAIACAMPAAAQTGAASPLAAAPVRVAGESSEQSFDGVVEAVRQTRGGRAGGRRGDRAAT